MERNKIPSTHERICKELTSNNCDEIVSIIDDAINNDENTTWEAVQLEIYNGMDNLIREAQRVQQTLCK